MKSILTLGAGATALALLLPVPAAQAAEKDGLTCPPHTDATLSNGVLRCAVTLVYSRGSMCPPINFPNYTLISGTGRDQCKPQGKLIDNRNSVDSAMDPLVGPPTLKGQAELPADLGAALRVLDTALLGGPGDSAYVRQVNASGEDRFTAEKTVYLWPKDMPLQNMPGHQARDGVACPSGFDATPVSGGRGLRCSNEVIKRSGCDIGWTIERRTGRDLCTSKDLLGNRVVGQFTIPIDSGYMGVMGNPEQHGWNLDTDRGNTTTDYWIKEGGEHRYPVGR